MNIFFKKEFTLPTGRWAGTPTPHQLFTCEYCISLQLQGERCSQYTGTSLRGMTCTFHSLFAISIERHSGTFFKDCM